LRPTFRRLAACPWAALLFLVTLAGCQSISDLTFSPQTRGNMVDPALLSQLVPGTSTRTDVTSLIGSPTTRATFDDNTWIYIGEVTKPVIGGVLMEKNQKVVVLTFAPSGVLKTITEKTMADAKPVTVVNRATPSPGNDTSLIQQLLGNVGRFSPGGNLGSAGGSSGPVTGGTGSANQF
jgi:outer membrane protein assembly factor BamE (lipoprotein component of BamABCDE complex)